MRWSRNANANRRSPQSTRKRRSNSSSSNRISSPRMPATSSIGLGTTRKRGPDVVGPAAPGSNAPGGAAASGQVISIIFSRTAYTTASMRECRCSFSRMFRMWFLTVFSEM
jgi:hypothetical protein